MEKTIGDKIYDVEIVDMKKTNPYTILLTVRMSMRDREKPYTQLGYESGKGLVFITVTGDKKEIMTSADGVTWTTRKEGV